MAINFRVETLNSFAQIAAILPPDRCDRPSSGAKVRRWANDGVTTAKGVVRLETIRVGGRQMTSVEAVQRFFDAVTEAGPAVHGVASGMAARPSPAAAAAGD